MLAAREARINVAIVAVVRVDVYTCAETAPVNQGAVDPVGSPLDLLDPLGRGLVREDPGRQVGDRLLFLREGEVHQPAAGWNWGRVSSSSKATISSSRGMPTRTSAGSTPITSDTSRVPSSSSTRPTTSG